MKDKEKGLSLIRFLITYILVRILFKLFNFHYGIINDKFNVLKLTIDLGSWIGVWVIVSFILKKCNKIKDT